ncbi:hypothetical protein Ctob_006739 [Chrysochromulina tobinii]|uniref:Uncharacterized protein n=1 Tax=Chrysochromulina tobinii TaxID=1460289 RepID=A0A0M0JBN9_9EUKA|nr:hypothetical protein Ctob_006739 [Chrysochromulina tobinii]|eukprot:KOO23643.1 hypothetical protein Ctob_006739 [Chrysochromulina sp. CCMP291]
MMTSLIRCATHPADVLRIELPAPQLPNGWSFDSELAAFATGARDGAARGKELPNLEHQARREEFQGHYGQAYASFLAAYSATDDLSLILCAARLKLRPLGDPRVAAELLAGVIERCAVMGTDVAEASGVVAVTSGEVASLAPMTAPSSAERRSRQRWSLARTKLHEIAELRHEIAELSRRRLERAVSSAEPRWGFRIEPLSTALHVAAPSAEHGVAPETALLLADLKEGRWSQIEPDSISRDSRDSSRDAGAVAGADAASERRRGREPLPSSAAGALHVTMLNRIDAQPLRPNSARPLPAHMTSLAKLERARAVLVGWLLVHTGLVREAQVRLCLEEVWRAADSLARAISEHEQFNGQSAQVFMFADRLLRSAPQAAPVRPTRRSASAVAERCAALCDEALSWVHSRPDVQELNNCLITQQQRAFSRAAGFRISAALLQASVVHCLLMVS